MSAVLLAAIGAHGAVSILITILIAGLAAAIAYWLLGLFAPHPIPVIAAIVVFLLILLVGW